jgi:hypothetical protein
MPWSSPSISPPPHSLLLEPPAPSRRLPRGIRTGPRPSPPSREKVEETAMPTMLSPLPPGAGQALAITAVSGDHGVVGDDARTVPCGGQRPRGLGGAARSAERADERREDGGRRRLGKLLETHYFTELSNGGSHHPQPAIYRCGGVLHGWMRVFAYLYPFNSTYIAGTRIQTITLCDSKMCDPFFFLATTVFLVHSHRSCPTPTIVSHPRSCIFLSHDRVFR